MKFIISISLMLLFFGVQAQKSKVTIETSFKGIIEGYDHSSQYKIYIDNSLVMTTPTHSYSEPYKLKLKTKRGNHLLKLVHYTLYEGNWEVTSIENNYTLDCTIEENINFGKKTKIEIVNDLDSPTVPLVTVN